VNPISVSGPQGLGPEQRLGLMRDGIINYSGTLVGGLLAIILVPIVLAAVGAEAYGFWIAILAVAAAIGTFDFGLGYAITHAVASASESEGDQVTAFVRSAGSIYVLVGVVGGILTAMFGLPLSGMLHLPAGLQSLAPKICLITGIYCFSQSLMTFANSVLNGIGRFEILSRIAIGSGVLRTIAVLLVLWTRGTLVGISLCYALTSLLGASVTLVVVARIRPELAVRLYMPRWASLRGYAEFSIVGQLARTAGFLSLETSPPLLIGALLGPSAIVPFYIGQKFPLALAQLGGSSAQVLFSHGGRYANSCDGLRDFVRVGTRWMALLLTGPGIILGVLAPNLLQAWMGEASTATVWVMGISLLDVLVVGIGEGAANALWALGAARSMLVVNVTVAVPSLVASFLLLKVIGVVGASLGLLIATSLASAAYFFLAGRRLSIPGLGLIAGAFEKLTFPVLAAAAMAIAIHYFVDPRTWLTVLTGLCAAGLTYTGVLYFSAARPEEAALIGELATLPLQLLRWARRPRGKMSLPSAAPQERQP
jgi:O-antigen/teichoic acid export membrane protein